MAVKLEFKSNKKLEQCVKLKEVRAIGRKEVHRGERVRNLMSSHWMWKVDPSMSSLYQLLQISLYGSPSFPVFSM